MGAKVVQQKSVGKKQKGAQKQKRSTTYEIKKT